MNILLVAGSRDIEGDWLYHTFDNMSYVFDVNFDRIISGGARGVDTYAEKWAELKGYDFREYTADWETFGNQAGYLRNVLMVKTCSHAVIVYDGSSPGTAHTMKLLLDYEKPHIVRYIFG